MNKSDVFAIIGGIYFVIGLFSAGIFNGWFFLFTLAGLLLMFLAGLLGDKENKTK